MIIALLAAGWICIVTIVLGMCRTSALADRAAPDMLPLELPLEQRATQPTLQPVWPQAA